MENLNELRDKIDEIDKNIVCLFEERMETVLKVAAYKKQNNMLIFDEDREKKVIEKNMARLKNRAFEESLEKFFVYMMGLSKEEQKKIIDNSSFKGN